jgi:hypothetical protein
MPDGRCGKWYGDVRCVCHSPRIISVTNFNRPDLLICEGYVISFSIRGLTTETVVGWTIPFTACATSVAALLTQGFLAHR